MVKNINRVVKCNKGGRCFSKRGAMIKEYAEKAVEEVISAETDSMIVIKGCGSSL